MRWITALLALFLLTAASPRPACIQPADRPCTIDDGEPLKLGDQIWTMERVIHVPPEALPLQRQLTVNFAGLASVEFTWNGSRIGSNGRPGRDRRSEVPGYYYASILVPSELIRPGDNIVAARLSGQHLWLPVEDPIHILDVQSYETPELPGRSAYLPALLALGAILAGLVYFLVAAFNKSGSGSWQVAAFALATALQLIFEISRAFIAFTYPAALGRVAAIAVLAGAASMLMASYAAQRFQPRWRTWLITTTGLASLASLILIPWFDIKAMAALLAGALALGAASLIGLHRGLDGPRWGLAASAAIMIAMLVERTGFLDRSWHLIAASLLMLLVLEQIGLLRRARADALRLAGIEKRLRQAESAGEPIVQLKDGAKRHRVAECDILYARAADDYCEVHLIDGRELLVTTGLAKLMADLPPHFARVHKSYLVNRRQLRSIEPKPGGGRLLILTDGSRIPVGRSYADALTEAESGAAAFVRPSPAVG